MIVLFLPLFVVVVVVPLLVEVVEEVELLALEVEVGLILLTGLLLLEVKQLTSEKVGVEEALEELQKLWRTFVGLVHPQEMAPFFSTRHLPNQDYPEPQLFLS